MSISEVPKSSTPSNPMHTFPDNSPTTGHTFKKRHLPLSDFDISEFLKSDKNSLQKGPTASLKRRKISNASENKGETREDEMSSQSVFSSSSSSTDSISFDGNATKDEQEASSESRVADQSETINEEYLQDLQAIVNLLNNTLIFKGRRDINWPYTLSIQLGLVNGEFKKFKDKHGFDVRGFFAETLKPLQDEVREFEKRGAILCTKQEKLAEQVLLNHLQKKGG